MLSDKEKAALFDIRYNILAAQRFINGLTFEQFSASDIHTYAVIRALEIISEASRRLPQELHQRRPRLPWRQIQDADNAYRHGYDNLGVGKVWKTAQNSLPPLMTAVCAEIEALGEGQS